MDRLAVTFVLPKLVDHPIGGYKIHYQYADGLARRGHAVTLLHPISGGTRASLRDRLLLRRAVRAQQRLGRPPIGWFDFDPSVRSIVVPTLDAGRLPAADVTILTAWQTAARTFESPRRAGALVQVVYDYEFWMDDPGTRPAMRRALGRSDVMHVATSRVVAEMLEEIGADPVAILPAGLAEGEFGVDAPIEARGPVVGFARRFQPSKDAATALAAAEAIHEACPEATITCFGGASHSPAPSYVQDVGRLTHAELRAFYNRCSVFLLTSRYEGWGLPALEAMACGAAVVSTMSGGVQDFVHDGDNGALVPVADPSAIASAAVELLSSGPRRQSIARRAATDASTWTLSASLDRLETVIEAALGSRG